MDDVYKREAYWALCPWCDEKKCIDHTTCKAVEEFAEQLRSESKEANSTTLKSEADEQAPTIPAEIIVHCKDCKKRDTPSCNMTHNMGGGRFLTCNEDLGYCNLAEMKHIEINKGEENK